MSRSVIINFEVNDFERKLFEIAKRTPSPGKWCICNTIRHLNIAWSIKDIDPSMAIFSCITAEEESVTAIFHSLKRRRYPDAAALDPKNHVHKNAVFPFFNAISHFLVEWKDKLPKIDYIFVSERSKEILKLFITEQKFGIKLTSDFPLEFSIYENGIESDFSCYLDKILFKTRFKNVLKYLRDRANMRNKLLYASSAGLPNIASDLDAAFNYYKRNTFLNIVIYLLIDQHPEHQSFVKQSLSAFIKMLKSISQSKRI